MDVVRHDAERERRGRGDRRGLRREDEPDRGHDDRERGDRAGEDRSPACDRGRRHEQDADDRDGREHPERLEVGEVRVVDEGPRDEQHPADGESQRADPR